jgi:hypothetical protein
MAVEGDYLVFAGTEKPGSSDAQCIVIDDPAGTAAVLLELAKTVLQKTGESSKSTVLLEAGLLETNSLRAPSNDLKSLKVSKGIEVNPLKGDEDQNEGQTGKLNTITITALSEGLDSDVIRYFATKKWYVKVLNNSVNPLKAARTMMAKPKFKDQYLGWLKNNPAPAPSGKLSAMEIAEIKASVPPADPDESAFEFQRVCLEDGCTSRLVVEPGQSMCSQCIAAQRGKLCPECCLDEAMEGHELCLQCRLAHVEVSDTEGL